MKKDKKKNSKFQSKEIKVKNYMNEDYKTITTLIIVLVVIGCFIGLLFFLNGKFVTKDHFQDNTTTTAKVKYDDSLLIVNDIFNIDDKEYFVLLYDAKDKTSNFLYSGLISSYKDDKISLYSIDLSNSMNKKYYNKEGKINKTPKNASEVLVNGPTLMVIKNGKVSSYITEKEKIVEKLS